ncbi:oligosaccharide flippase family protein [Adhaeribacter swui]|uniref:Oligosaccharide flippase family protein n=1 Tax=Adhaeribacter swui TaxID=2086471 RepID=A0A7G7GCV0_9BACT|nr:oligosaccharide flippase family protein [Adhaeribacter swui]QNF34984.1 oligosaccharide flippase family protein [Adhaeribacter swui]
MIDLIKKYIKSEVIKNFFVYSFGAIFLKGVTFFLIPIYTKILKPEEFGQLELINTVISILSIIYGFGLTQLVFIKYFKLNKEEKKTFLTKINLIYIGLAVPLFALTAIFLLNNNIFSLPNNSFSIITLILLSAFLTFFQLNFFSISQLEKKAVFLTNFKLLSGILVLVLNVILVYYYRLGISGILFSNFAVLLLTALFIITKNKEYFSFASINKIQKKEVADLLKMGIPFILSSLSSWLMIAADRWLIAYFLQPSSVGIYSVAFKFAIVFEPLLIAPILSVYNPYIFEKFKRNNLNQNSLKLIVGVICIFFLLSIISYLGANLMIDESFSESLSLIPILVLGFAFSLLAQVFAALMIYQNKSKLLVQNVLISSLINIFINCIFIKYFGLFGVATAFLLSNFTWFLLTFFQNYKLKQKLKLAAVYH